MTVSVTIKQLRQILLALTPDVVVLYVATDEHVVTAATGGAAGWCPYALREPYPIADFLADAGQQTTHAVEAIT